MHYFIMVCSDVSHISVQGNDTNLTPNDLMMTAWPYETNTTLPTMTTCKDILIDYNHSDPMQVDFGNGTLLGDFHHERVKHYINDIMLPIVFAFGVFGNIMNLVIFTRRRIRSRMSEVEKAATTGLMSLALADLCFCIVGLVSHFLSPFETEFATSQMVISAFYYSSYKKTLLNTFLFISTWVITVLSIERWAAATYPFLARRLVDVRRSIYINIGIYVVSIIFNIPQFLQDDFEKTQCTPNCYCIARTLGPLRRHPALREAYEITWAVVGTFIPIVLLVFCNIRFLQEIHNSRAQFQTDNKIGSRRSNASTGSKTTFIRITVILAAIISMFLLLVGPSSIVVFFSSRIPHANRAAYNRFRMCLVIFNLTQAINFAANFLLYCTMSREFRSTLIKLMCRKRKCTNGNGSPTQDTKNLTEQNSGVTALRANHISMDTKFRDSVRTKPEWL